MPRWIFRLPGAVVLAFVASVTTPVVAQELKIAVAADVTSNVRQCKSTLGRLSVDTAGLEAGTDFRPCSFSS